MIYLLVGFLLQASSTTQRYCYKSQPDLTVVVFADTWEDGMKEAGRTCFKALTKGAYPGEEKGLDIIDVCSNPRKCN